MNNSESKKRKMKFGVKFMLAMIFIYALSAFFIPYTILAATIETYNMLCKVLPILLGVFVVMFILNYYVSPRLIKKHVGEGSGVRGWLYAIIAGFFFVGPPYILYPVLGDLKRGGMKDSLLSALLYTKNIGIAFLPVMAFYFGLKYTLIIVFYTALFAVLGGLIMPYFTRNKNIKCVDKF